jgi:hypothetical protein
LRGSSEAKRSGGKPAEPAAIVQNGCAKPSWLQSFAARRFVATSFAAGAVRVASVEIGIAAGLSYVREQSEEAFSLCRPICNCVLSIGVLDYRVRDTMGQHVFDEDAVGQYLSDVSVAGTRLRATRGFQLNRNDTMTGADQVVWTPGEGDAGGRPATVRAGDCRRRHKQACPEGGLSADGESGAILRVPPKPRRPGVGSRPTHPGENQQQDEHEKRKAEALSHTSRPSGTGNAGRMLLMPGRSGSARFD